MNCDWLLNELENIEKEVELLNISKSTKLFLKMLLPILASIEEYMVNEKEWNYEKIKNQLINAHKK